VVSEVKVTAHVATGMVSDEIFESRHILPVDIDQILNILLKGIRRRPAMHTIYFQSRLSGLESGQRITCQYLYCSPSNCDVYVFYIRPVNQVYMRIHIACIASKISLNLKAKNVEHFHNTSSTYMR
jgi:hypothetical protein